MIIFRISFTFFLILVLVSSGNAVESPDDQNNKSNSEIVEENSRKIVDNGDNKPSSSNLDDENKQKGIETENQKEQKNIDHETEVPSSPENERVQENKRQKLYTPEEEADKGQSSRTNPKDTSKIPPATKISDIPQKILDFFNDPELPEDEYLDWESSKQYQEPENPTTTTFKKIFEKIQKHTPFMIQREKFEGVDTFYFPAFGLGYKILKPEDVSEYQQIKKLKKFFPMTNTVYDDLNHLKYYDWRYTSSTLNKRLIPSCPKKKEETIPFPAGKILKATAKDENQTPIVDPLTIPIGELEEAAFISDDEDDEKNSTPDKTVVTQSNSETTTDQDSIASDQSPNNTPAQTSTADQPLPTSNPSNETDQLNQSSSSTPAKSSNSKKSPSRINSLDGKNKKSLMSSIASIDLSKSVSEQVSKWRHSGKSEGSSTIKNVFSGRIFKASASINDTDYYATRFPCDAEVAPTFVKEEVAFQNIDAYYAGYMVEFNKKVKPMYSNYFSLTDKMLWFHVAHLMRDKKTKDTFSIFSYAPFYDTVRKTRNIPIYTDYTVNKYSHVKVDYYERMYSIENQQKIFQRFKNYERYFNPKTSLYLAKQELMDQKSVPTMSFKRVALDYMNIVPMFKVIQDNAWRKVENVVLKLPMVSASSSVIFITGTYGELLIEGSPIYLDDGSKDKSQIKRLKVPYAFYKVVHVTYHSPRFDRFIHNHMKFFFNIVIVTHNDPFETKPKKLCDTPVMCESIGWKKVVQNNPALGFTYCCAFTKKFADDFDIEQMYAGIETKPLDDVGLGLLDLRVLWYVERNTSTCPLDRDEFPLMRKEKPVYETVETIEPVETVED